MTNIIFTIKLDRVAGVDKVQSAMLMEATLSYFVKLTELINDCLASGRVPSALQTGKMTLIDNKDPSLEVKNKHLLNSQSLVLF